ncbi:response regulator [Maribius pontilimi]|uniref:Response regulator n=1 Tax=Palleronia pontilimi TaxID=1964209 RepID=A0A934IG66_9RHOB|nr:response regulator [Palleronia pontilimi]
MECPGTRQGAADGSGSEPGSETILVVEDDLKVPRRATAGLTELGDNTVTASSGPGAISVLTQRADIDLVLSDVVMPGGMSGFEVAKAAHGSGRISRSCCPRDTPRAGKTTDPRRPDKKCCASPMGWPNSPRPCAPYCTWALSKRPDDGGRHLARSPEGGSFRPVPMNG